MPILQLQMQRLKPQSQELTLALLSAEVFVNLLILLKQLNLSFRMFPLSEEGLFGLFLT